MHSKLIQKITAPNASMFTGGGTNTYLIGKEEITIVDPGPNIETHINEIANTVGEKATRILVTHTHRDHSPGVRPLKDILKICGLYELNNNEKNFLDICEFLFKNKYELIGMLNHTYVDNKLIIFDCYFKVNKL